MPTRVRAPYFRASSTEGSIEPLGLPSPPSHTCQVLFHGGQPSPRLLCTMNPRLQRMCINPGAPHGEARSQGPAANPRIKAETILLTIHSRFSLKSIHNRTVKLVFPLLLQTIVKMIGICPGGEPVCFIPPPTRVELPGRGLHV